jgi:hypothetical protein
MSFPRREDIGQQGCRIGAKARYVAKQAKRVWHMHVHDASEQLVVAANGVLRGGNNL